MCFRPYSPAASSRASRRSRPSLDVTARRSRASQRGAAARGRAGAGRGHARARGGTRPGRDPVLHLRHGGHQTLCDRRGDGPRRRAAGGRRRCAGSRISCSACPQAARRSASTRSWAACTRRETSDFSRATAFAVDEFVGLDRTHPGSFHRFISEHLLGGVNIPAHRFHSLNGAADDPRRRMRAIRGRD